MSSYLRISCDFGKLRTWTGFSWLAFSAAIYPEHDGFHTALAGMC